MNGLMTVEQVATKLGVIDETVYRWLRHKKLRGLKAGRQWRIRETDLADFLKGAGQNTGDTQIKICDCSEQVADPAPRQ